MTAGMQVAQGVRVDIFPSRTPIASRTIPSPTSSTNSIHSRNTSMSSRPHRTAAVPRMLDSESSDEEGSPRHRSARAKYQPALPAGAEWLLLTMAPPPPSPPQSTSSPPSSTPLDRSVSRSSTHSQASSFRDESDGGFMKKVFSGLRAPSVSRKSSKVALGSTEEGRFNGAGAKGSKLVHSQVPLPQHSRTMSLSLSPIFPSRPSGPATEPPCLSPAQPFPSMPSAASLENRRERVLSRLDLFGRNPNYHRDGSTVPGSAGVNRHVSPYVSLPPTTPLPSLPSPQPLSRSVAKPTLAPLNTSRPLTPPLSPPSPSSSPEHASTKSIVNDPKLMAILSRTDQIFATKVSLITILTADEQRFIASKGMPEEVDALPRSAGFCGHAVQNETDGLVVLDASKDPRFKNNVVTVVLSARFYAGAPIFATSPSRTDRITIGTLCICDDKPRDAFGPEERAMLKSLAAEVSEEIELWVSERSSSPSSTSTSLPSLYNYSSSFTSNVSSARDGNSWSPATPYSVTPKSPAMSLPPTPPQSIRRPSTINGDLAGDMALPIAPYAIDDRRSSLPASPKRVDEGSPRRSRRSVQKKHRDSTKVNSWAENQGEIAEEHAGQATGEFRTSAEHSIDHHVATLLDTCKLSLVYLVRITLTTPSPRLTLLSSAGLSPTQTKPSFDPVLHLKALQAPEGGLLYRNPNSPTSTKKAYAAGILLPVTENKDFGWVVAGYTKDWEREFAEEDLEEMSMAANRLAKLLEI